MENSVIGALAAAAVAVTVASPGVPPMTFTTDQVAHWETIVHKSLSTATNAQARAQAVGALAEFAWVDGEARDGRITTTDDEVQARFIALKQRSFPSDADYQRFLRQSGMTQEDVLLRVRENLLEERILARVTAPATAGVTDAVVDAYVKQHPEIERETRDVRIVTSGTRAGAQKAKTALEHGATWVKVEREYGHDLELVRRHGLAQHLYHDEHKHLSNAIFKAHEGRLSGPVKTPFGYAVFEVVTIHPRHTVPLRTQRRRARERLTERAAARARADFTQAFDAKWTPRTTCAPGYTQARECANRG